MEVTYTRAKVPNSFSRRMKLLCNTLTEHDELKEGKKNTYGDNDNDGNVTVSDERSSFDFKYDDDDNVNRH